MHSAPAARYPVVRSVRAGAWLFAVWASAAAVFLWFWSRGGVGVWHVLAVSASLSIGGAVAIVQWCRSPTGWLRWDGQAWWWRFADKDEVSVTVWVRLDLQQAMLLEITVRRGRSAWCCLEQATLPSGWADVRRALYSFAPDSGAVVPP